MLLSKNTTEKRNVDPEESLYKKRNNDTKGEPLASCLCEEEQSAQ